MTIKDYQPMRWFNSKTGELLWGIRAKINNSWHPVCDGKKPLFYPTRKEAVEKIKTLKDLK